MTETKKNPIGQFIENTLVPISTAFAQNRYVRCIGTGSQNLMAIIMIGAVFNLLNSIQIDPYQSFIQATGIAAFLNAVYNACMNFMGVFMVFSVGYAGAKIFGHDEMAFNNGLMSLMSYLIMVPVATNEVGSTVVVLDYLGSHGVFLAFILGIMATKINIALVERNITIKMPAGVPENVTQCFTSIIPGAAIALVSSLLRGLFTLHFRDPGFTYKEDLQTGSAAAAAGGFTTVVCMANTKPVVDSVDIYKEIEDRCEQLSIKVWQAAAVSKGFEGKELTDMDALYKAGVRGFTDDGIPLMDEKLVEEAMKKAKELDVPISLHEEDPAYIKQPGVNQGKVSEQLNYGGASYMAEAVMVKRDCELAVKTGAKVDIQHISSGVAVDNLNRK